MEFELLAKRHSIVRQRDLPVHREPIIDALGASDAPGRERA
jgi:hypothetical protein